MPQAEAHHNIPSCDLELQNTEKCNTLERKQHQFDFSSYKVAEEGVLVAEDAVLDHLGVGCIGLAVECVDDRRVGHRHEPVVCEREAHKAWCRHTALGKLCLHGTAAQTG